MELIRQNDLCFGQTGGWARARASLIMKIAAIKQVNRLYDDTLSYPGPYPEGLLHNLQVSYETFPEELEHIPRSGAAFVVANHPTGALDGIVLIDLLSKLGIFFYQHILFLRKLELLSLKFRQSLFQFFNPLILLSCQLLQRLCFQ